MGPGGRCSRDSAASRPEQAPRGPPGPHPGASSAAAQGEGARARSLRRPRRRPRRPRRPGPPSTELPGSSEPFASGRATISTRWCRRRPRGRGQAGSAARAAPSPRTPPPAPPPRRRAFPTIMLRLLHRRRRRARPSPPVPPPSRRPAPLGPEPATGAGGGGDAQAASSSSLPASSLLPGSPRPDPAAGSARRAPGSRGAMFVILHLRERRGRARAREARRPGRRERGEGREGPAARTWSRLPGGPRACAAGAGGWKLGAAARESWVPARPRQPLTWRCCAGRPSAPPAPRPAGPRSLLCRVEAPRGRAAHWGL
nr:basic proline-rich protein-like [Chlorocebus sabaeus]XP_037839192.1 basic proline-rich protein-like [Chlorocebus sabaeus]